MVVSNHWTGIQEQTTGLTFFEVTHFKSGLLHIWVTCDKNSVINIVLKIAVISQMGSIQYFTADSTYLATLLY